MALLFQGGSWALWAGGDQPLGFGKAQPCHKGCRITLMREVWGSGVGRPSPISFQEIGISEQSLCLNLHKVHEESHLVVKEWKWRARSEGSHWPRCQVSSLFWHLLHAGFLFGACAHFYCSCSKSKTVSDLKLKLRGLQSIKLLQNNCVKVMLFYCTFIEPLLTWLWMRSYIISIFNIWCLYCDVSYTLCACEYD